MTLLIAKHCTDGILLVADSIAIQDDGQILANGVKTISGERGDRNYALVFGGFAGCVGGIQTIDALNQAVLTTGDDLPKIIRNAMQARLVDEVEHGDWTEDDGLVNVAKREMFRHHQDITVLLSPKSDVLWGIRVTAEKPELYQEIALGIMAITQPGPDAAAYQELLGMRNDQAQTMNQALQSAALLFQRATVRFPYDCCYPACVLRHTANGVLPMTFPDYDSLRASAGD